MCQTTTCKRLSAWVVDGWGGVGSCGGVAVVVSCCAAADAAAVAAVVLVVALVVTVNVLAVVTTLRRHVPEQLYESSAIEHSEDISCPVVDLATRQNVEPTLPQEKSTR